METAAHLPGGLERRIAASVRQGSLTLTADAPLQRKLERRMPLGQEIFGVCAGRPVTVAVN
jgi:hypothetical protein